MSSACTQGPKDPGTPKGLRAEGAGRVSHNRLGLSIAVDEAAAVAVVCGAQRRTAPDRRKAMRGPPSGLALNTTRLGSARIRPGRPQLPEGVGRSRPPRVPVVDS